MLNHRAFFVEILGIVFGVPFDGLKLFDESSIEIENQLAMVREHLSQPIFIPSTSA